MKTTLTAIATLILMTGALFAYNGPRYTRNGGTCPNGNTGQQSGQRMGKKTGPQDGSGPLHTPGTSGGTGAGQRRGRR
jgi:hypothetical protein